MFIQEVILTGNFKGESALESIKSCCIQHTSSFPAHNLSQCHSRQQSSSVYNDDGRLGRSDMPVKLGYDVIPSERSSNLQRYPTPTTIGVNGGLGIATDPGLHQVRAHVVDSCRGGIIGLWVMAWYMQRLAAEMQETVRIRVIAALPLFTQSQHFVPHQSSRVPCVKGKLVSFVVASSTSKRHTGTLGDQHAKGPPLVERHEGGMRAKIDSCVRVLVVDDRCPDDKSQI
ncbi:hypothetical protein I7I51_05966 [Histoplasma capsulatum]|uniref:Uncharacterized protein n=1 Tax=Ajellomyces capsulatus TaxID=5037 RepID=A0A8A1MGV9_AJECA|nr:hypothetical protein I7I51_05966 [Histoplasma capsulatum]